MKGIPSDAKFAAFLGRLLILITHLLAENQSAISFQNRPPEAFISKETLVIATSVIMDPVSRNLDREILDSDDGREAVADLKSQLGALQIGGGRDLLMDDYDVVDEKPEVATITPDDSADEPELEPRADDCRYFEAWGHDWILPHIRV